MTGPGDTIGVKYRIEQELGAGNRGTVFEVSHGISGKHFALKLLRAEAAKSDGAIRRFMHEVQIAGGIQHPNIVEVHDVGQAGDSFFIVMELLRGESLAQRLERRHQLRASVAGELLAPCMQAVSAAHGAGVVHGELQPRNIFLARSQPRGPEVPKVLDFGVAKLFEHHGTTLEHPSARGVVLGTPQYMSPEQLRNMPIDPRTDVYAFGVMLYELLAGVRPFDAASFPDLLLRVLHEDPPPLESHASDVPPALANVVAKALARDPDERYQTVDALLTAFQRSLPSPRVRQRQDVMHFHSYRPGTQPAVVAPPRQREGSLRAVVTKAGALPRAAGWPVVAMFGSALAAALLVVVLTNPRPSVEAVSPAPPLQAAAARELELPPTPATRATSTAPNEDDSRTLDAGMKTAERDP